MPPLSPFVARIAVPQRVTFYEPTAAPSGKRLHSRAQGTGILQALTLYDRERYSNPGTKATVNRIPVFTPW